MPRGLGNLTKAPLYFPIELYKGQLKVLLSLFLIHLP
jgi:hypothetical protein